MESVTEEANSSDHNGWSYIIRVTWMGKLITYKAHIQDLNHNGVALLGADEKRE